MTAQEIIRRRNGRLSIGDPWAVVIALYPLIRFLLLATPLPGLTGLQLAERFFWLAFWPIEALVILVAATRGFQIAAFIRSLPKAPRALLLAWAFSVIAGSAMADYPALALRSAAGWAVHAVFAMALWHLATCDRAAAERQFERLTEILPLTVFAVGMLTMARTFQIGLSSDYPFVTDLPGFAHIRHTGYIFAPAMALCLARMATANRSSGVATLLLALNAGLCLWFGSRGPFIGLAAGLAISLFALPEFRRPALMVRSAFALFAGAVLSIAVPSPDNPGFNAIRRFTNALGDANEFSSGRTAFWKDTARMVLDRPFLGHGGEQFQFISVLAQKTYRHPHDFILQFLFDWGLIGGGALLALLALVLLAALRVRRHGSETARIGFFGALCMLGFALIDGILFYPFTIAITILFLAMALLPVVSPADGHPIRDS